MDLPELPECPVCLQSYDAASTTPRVLACGHSTCETCLTQLPKPFPHTIRCPSCTQLVKYPHPQGPSALPKNIDLLRLSSLLQSPNPKIPQQPINKQKLSPQNDPQFIPNLWSHEFYSNWKDWVLPHDAVLVESSEENDGVCYVLCGKIGNFEGSYGLPVRCLIKGNQQVSLFKVGSFLKESGSSKFNYNDVAKIMNVLYGMKDGERGEMGLILRASLRQCGICKVYGLWYNKDDEGVYIVSERFSWNFLKKLDELKNGEKMDSGGEGDMSGFAMISMGICEAVSGLHSEGLIAGCLDISCFDFDNFGHVCIDFNAVLATGRRFCRIISEAVSGKRKNDSKESEVSLKDDILKTQAFVSPELLFELLQKDGIHLGSGSLRYEVAYGSDIWLLACVLVWVLVGKPFIEEMHNYLCCVILGDEKDSDYMGLYMDWLEKVSTLLETILGLEFDSLKGYLCKCLDFDPGRRPLVTDLWKCIRELIIRPKFDMMVILKQAVTTESTGCCLVLGELCQLQKETKKGPERQMINGLGEKDDNSGADVDQAGELRVDRSLIESLSGDRVKCIDLKGHLDCITGLAVGGGFLFSSSFDKTVHVWSLQDFTHIHSFNGHEHRVMAVVFVDEEEPLCISGDSGGGICIWGIDMPFAQEPLKKLYEQNDWRYSGIHALAISGTGYVYTGSGDKSIKAWSMQDYTVSCTMTGHKSVVSTLAVCNGILYSGSWDGTVRLWCISDHSPLTVLGEDTPGNITSVLSLAANRHELIVAHENGCIKIWSHDVLLKSTQAHNGATFSVSLEGNWIFSGGWDKTIIVQELSGDKSQIDAIPIGSIPCSSVVTALLYWEGKLLVGQADRVIKVYYHGV